MPVQGRMILFASDQRVPHEVLPVTNETKVRYAIALWYADAPGTVVTLDGPGGIEEMRRRLPSAEYRFFKGAGHSIHNDPISKQGWMEGLKAAVDEAALRASGSTAAQVRGG